MKSGFVVIIGKPNVGKSTLINALLERKISIVTDKAQTTRNSIKGIYDDGDCQIVFVDTPGVHKPRHSLGRLMNKDIVDSSKDVDATILAVDASKKIEDDDLVEKLIDNSAPLFVVMNKIDLITLPRALEIKEYLKSKFSNSILIETSAIEGFNVDFLLSEVKKCMPDGPRYFPEDAVSDKDSSFFVSEVIREKLLKLLKEEVPHDLAVRVDDIKHKSEAVYIHSTIIVDKDSHKGIVIGKSGKMIKLIGTKARKDLEEYFGKRIFLELFVSVKEDWLNNNRILKELGYK